MSCENCPFLEDCRGRRADLLREKEGFERRLRGLEEPALGTDPDLDKNFFEVVRQPALYGLRNGPTKFWDKVRLKSVDRSRETLKETLKFRRDSAVRGVENLNGIERDTRESCVSGPRLVKRRIIFGRKMNMCASPAAPQNIFYEIPRNKS